MSKLFVSHAAHDLALVGPVVDLLESGVGVPHKDIFCTSLKGQNIRPGEDFVDSIQKSLGNATCVLALISEAYYASAFCMCELGGVWLQSKSFLPVLIPPVEYTNLKAVLGGLQVSKIGSDEDLDELRDELVRRLGIEGHSTPRWNAKRDAFLKVLAKHVRESKFNGPVPRTAHEKLTKELVDYKKAYAERETEICNLNSTITDLKKLKDAKAVAKVVQKHSRATDTFEELVAAASTSLKRLEKPVREALYYRARGEDYHPDGRDDWDDARGQIEYGALAMNSSENGVTPNERDPKVRKAVEALDALDKWLESSLPQEFFEWYETEADGEQLDIKLRTFWERHLS